VCHVLQPKAGPRRDVLPLGGFQDADLQELQITQRDFPACIARPHASISAAGTLVGNIHRSGDEPFHRRLLIATKAPGERLRAVLMRRINPVVPLKLAHTLSSLLLQRQSHPPLRRAYLSPIGSWGKWEFRPPMRDETP
jgi:hypothetical protein